MSTGFGRLRSINRDKDKRDINASHDELPYRS